MSSLSHENVMHRLKSAKWPLVLRFERPLAEADVTLMPEILELDQTTPGGLPDDFKLQMIKRLLAKGLVVRKHGRSGKPHDSVLYINETMVFWQVRNALKLQADSKIVRKKKNVPEDEQVEPPGLSLMYDLTKGVSLYDPSTSHRQVAPAFKRSVAKRARAHWHHLRRGPDPRLRGHRGVLRLRRRPKPSPGPSTGSSPRPAAPSSSTRRARHITRTAPAHQRSSAPTNSKGGLLLGRGLSSASAAS